MSDRSYSPRRDHSYSTRSSSPRSFYSSRSHSPNRRHSYEGRSHSPDYQERNYYYSRSPSYCSRSPRYEPSCTVFVGNLPYETSWFQLKDFMRDAGDVIHADVVKFSDGKSKGCGIVEYRYPEEAKRAIRMLNDVRFMGRYIYVRYHKTGKNERDSEPKEIPEDCKLFVKNLPLNVSWQDLKDMFRKAGRVSHTDVYTEPDSKKSNGTGLVIFEDPSDAHYAINAFNGHSLQGHVLEVMEQRYQHLKNDSPVQEPPLPEPHTEIYRYDTVPPPPPPPLPMPVPMYPSISLVGGIAAALPTHGHNQIYVNNLPFSTTWEDLIDLFRHAGSVTRAEIIVVNGHPKGIGYVRFEEANSCQKAIERFHGYIYGGRSLDIKLDKYSTTV
ncbi:hypothetical protein BY458DRAFT_511933 [Sporodiniella umbellata]|nr:hypothetical protein BY458DRAFT_511933 [Sporodiniella umbellata]